MAGIEVATGELISIERKVYLDFVGKQLHEGDEVIFVDPWSSKLNQGWIEKLLDEKWAVITDNNIAVHIDYKELIKL